MQKVNRYISKRYLHQGRVSKINISNSALNVLFPIKKETVSQVKQEDVKLVEQPIEQTIEQPISIEQTQVVIETPIVEIPIVEEVVEEEKEVVAEKEIEEKVFVQKENAFMKKKKEKENNK